jgi:class 3 adenylate cyclase
MQKVAPLNPGVAQDPAATTSRVLPFPASGDRTNRTSVCAVLFVDIVEYSKKPVSEQLQTKERFNVHIAEAIADVAPDERIILDTGDGVAISFLGDPEDALFVAINLVQRLESDAGEERTAVRAGINLGPVRLVRDINSQPNIIGDGINVAQRVMSFAQPTQVLVSRSYYDVVTRISEDYARMFAYQGSRTDKHVREHELYELVAPAAEAHEVTRRRSHTRRPGEDTLTSAAPPGAPLLRNRRLALAFTGVSILTLAAAALYYTASGPSVRPVERAAPAPMTRPAPVTRPAVVAVTPEPAPAPAAAPSETLVTEPAAPPLEPIRSTAPARATRSRPAAKPTSRRAPEQAAVVATAPEDAALPAPAAVPAQPAAEARPGGVEPWQPRIAPPAPAPAPATSRPAAGTAALVQLAISPWGEVYVNGKSAGVSPPMVELELKPGKYLIEVRNGEFKPYQEEVELGSHQTFRIKHKFTQQR